MEGSMTIVRDPSLTKAPCPNMSMTSLIENLVLRLRMEQGIRCRIVSVDGESAVVVFNLRDKDAGKMQGPLQDFGLCIESDLGTP